VVCLTLKAQILCWLASPFFVLAGLTVVNRLLGGKAHPEPLPQCPSVRPTREGSQMPAYHA
jgi:hypothetical protein